MVRVHVGCWVPESITLQTVRQDPVLGMYDINLHHISCSTVYYTSK